MRDWKMQFGADNSSLAFSVAPLQVDEFHEFAGRNHNIWRSNDY